MKHCNVCRLPKPVDQFALNRSCPDGRQKACRACKSARDRRRYHDATTGLKAQITRHRREHRDLLQDTVLQYLLSHPCVVCGEGDPVVLQFDHVRGTKVMDVGKAVQNGWSVSRLQSEVAKCDVRCANCHARRTAKVGGWYKLFHTGAKQK